MYCGGIRQQSNNDFHFYVRGKGVGLGLGWNEGVWSSVGGCSFVSLPTHQKPCEPGPAHRGRWPGPAANLWPESGGG